MDPEILKFKTRRSLSLHTSVGSRVCCECWPGVGRRGQHRAVSLQPGASHREASGSAGTGPRQRELNKYMTGPNN